MLSLPGARFPAKVAHSPRAGDRQNAFFNTPLIVFLTAGNLCDTIETIQ